MNSYPTFNKILGINVTGIKWRDNFTSDNFTILFPNEFPGSLINPMLFSFISTFYVL